MNEPEAPGRKWLREGEISDRWQGVRGLAKQLFCTCVLNMEDDCNKKFSGWEGCQVNLPAHHCTRLQSTTTTAVLTDSTSGISHEHNSNNSQCSKSNSKHHPRALTTPDIPFNVTEISSSGCYRGLENSSAHMEHYLSSYTYPHLEHMLAESLRVKRGVLCSTCSVTETSRLHEGRVKLRQGALDDLTHYRNSHFPYKRHHSISQKVTPTLTGVHSTPLVPPDLNTTTTSSSRDTGHTVNTRPHKQRQETSHSTSLPSKTDTITTVSYETAKHVYDMGVRWTPHTFPSFVVSASTSATTKPPHKTSRTVTKKRTPAPLVGESVGKNGTRVPTPLTCGAHMHVRGKKRQTGKSERTGHQDSVRSVATKTLTPFPIISSTCNPPTTSTNGMPPIKPQNQGLLATRRELSHLLRHKKCVSFHSGRSNFRYESLCLEGRSATANSERAAVCDNNDCSDTVSESGFRANSPVKIAGPWMK